MCNEDSMHAKNEAQNDNDGLSRPLFIASWSVLGLVAIGGVVFIIKHSISARRLLVRDANRILGEAVYKARDWISNGPANEAEATETQLTNALANELVTNKEGGKA